MVFRQTVNTYDYIIQKYGLRVGRQHVVEIPNMGRDDLGKLFAELDFKKGAEIGVESGAYSEVLLKANPKLHLYSIDPWTASAYDPESYGVVREQIEYDALFSEASIRLNPYNCTVIRKCSLEAAKKIKDNTLDFVYIDANHDFVNVANDIHTWKKKIKVGGILAGHDYCYFTYRKFNHVKRVIEAYTRCYYMIPYFVVGSFEVKTGETRDKYRSWFWVKK